jgi:DNA-binding transcriptional LysR family regulator
MGWIGVGGLAHIDNTGLHVIQIEGVRIIPVAAPNHPLALAGGASPSDDRKHVQLVLSDKPSSKGRDYGVFSLTNWRVGDLTLKHKLLVAGVGWGGMPEPMVGADIESGRLVRLVIPD